MSIRLRELIRSVRTCKTAAEERDVIAKESAALREAFREGDIGLRHRNVAKLMYIHMLGYPTHFGQMECLKLIAANGFPEKRIGYLGLMILLDERQEVLMLVTNSVKMDLNHKNQFIVGLALASLGNICSAEMARDLAPDVERLLESSNPYIRKKAALCTRRIIKKVPDLVEQFAERAADLVHDKNHGVLLCGLTLMLEICEEEPSVVEKYRVQVPLLCKILRSLLSGGYSPEHDVGGINDPFLQVKILRLLRILGRGHTEASDQMSDILAQVAANIESNRNAGNAILYECVQTIMAIESIGGLRVLAVNILGRFLANKDNNIRYVALNTLARVVAVDTQAVQRHRVTIVDCVKDADVSIRRRALELVYTLVNESNIRNLTKELLDYLVVSDAEFKPDLTAKICTLIQRFAPDKRWHIDNLIAVMSQAGPYVKEEVCRALVVLVSNAAELHAYAARRMFAAAREKLDTAAPSLLTTALWTVGEFGEMLMPGAGGALLEDEPRLDVTDAQVVDLIEASIKLMDAAPAVKEYALTAALKLTARLPGQQARLQAMIAKHRDSVMLEVQQRSCEYLQLFKHDRIRPQLLERMPALDESTYAPNMAAAVSSTSRGGSAGGAGTSGGGAAPAAAQDDLVDLLGGTAPAAAAAPQSAVDALDELLGGISAPASGGPSSAPSAAAGDLLDMLGGAPAPVPASQNSLPAAEDPFGMLGGVAPPAASPQFPSVTAWQKGPVSISFSFAKEADPSTTIITATYTNAGPSDVTDFTLQAAVPKFMQIRLEPASSSTLPAMGLSSATQRIVVSNTMHGQKALVMRLRISYTADGQPALEQAEVGNFPLGL